MFKADLEDFLNGVDSPPILSLRNGRFRVNGYRRVWATDGRLLNPDATTGQLLTHTYRVVHFLLVVLIR